MNPWRLLTFAVAGLFFVGVHYMPDIAVYLTPMGTFIAGLATTHPVDFKSASKAQTETKEE